MGAGPGPGLTEVGAVALMAGAVAASLAAWRAARRARRAAEAGALKLQALQEALRRTVHDLNNPLAAAAINAELLRQVCGEDANARRLADNIQGQVQRARDCLAGLTNLARHSEAQSRVPGP